MNKSQLTILLDSLISSLYGFSYSLIPDELQAEQMVADAYSVFLIREANNLKELELAKDPRSRARLKREIQNHLVADIFDLAKKRAPQLQALLRSVKEHSEFYQLELLQRATLYLKEYMKFTREDLATVLGVKGYQVIELLHNSREKLLGAATPVSEEAAC